MIVRVMRVARVMQVARFVQTRAVVGRAVVVTARPAPPALGQSNGFRKSPTSLTKSDAVSYASLATSEA